MECVLKKTSQFKASFKLAKKRGLDISLLEDVVNKLMTDKPLEEKYHNHQLVGNFKDVWECHIQPDWLLLYLNLMHVQVIIMELNAELQKNLFHPFMKNQKSY